MFGEKQNQKIDSNSTGIQADGNITLIQNNGLSVAEVKELCMLFLRDNFPKLREEAIKAAELNVQNFAVTLEEKILEKSGDIILEKFKDPDIQAAINDAVQANARKGERANPSVLVNLITERASLSSCDFKDIVISEAITVAPKITKEQIAYLSFIHFMTHFGIQGLQHISQLEAISQKVLVAVSSGFGLSDSQKRHIQYAGTCNIASIMIVDIYAGWMNKLYKYFGYTDINKFKDDISIYTPSSKVLLEEFEKDKKDGQVTLTSVGQAIAISHLSTTLGKIDYSIWLK